MVWRGGEQELDGTRAGRRANTTQVKARPLPLPGVSTVSCSVILRTAGWDGRGGGWIDRTGRTVVDGGKDMEWEGTARREDRWNMHRMGS